MNVNEARDDGVAVALIVCK